jgi:hypothetical protein
MSFLRRFRKKKKEEIPAKKNIEETITDLERICGKNREVYDSLYETMLLDPRKIGTPIEDAVKRAERFEKEGEKLRAIVWYKIAGGLAIYEGDVEKVKKYFRKCEELSGKSYSILENPEEAVAKAQEYYRECLKEEE